MAITLEQYISEFESLDEYGEYADRLKEELEDHFDDTVHASMISGTRESDAQQKALQNLGEPQRIIHEFKTIMKFNNKWAMWLESWFLGIVSIPIFHFAGRIMGAGIPSDPVSGMGIVKSALTTLGLYILVFVILAVFYFFTIGKLLRFMEKKREAWFLAIGLFIPPALFGFLYTEVYLHSRGGFFIYFALVILPGIVDFFLYVKSAFQKKAEMVMNGGKKVSQKHRKVQKIFEWLPLLSSLLLIPLILLTNKPFVPLDSSYNRTPLDFLTFLRSLFEQINLPFLEINWTDILGGYEAFYVLAGIYIFLAIMSVYKIGVFLLEKSSVNRLVNFPWLRLTLLVYIVSLFFFVHVPENTNITWHVPVRNISADVKKQELGSLYRFGMYMDQPNSVESKPMYLYEVTPGANYISLRVPDKNGFPHEYYLTPRNDETQTQNVLESVNDFVFSKVSDVDVPAPFFHGFKDLPSGVNCVRESDKPVTIAQSFPSTVHVNEMMKKFCDKLFFNGKFILEQASARPLYQFELFPGNPRFALVKIETGEYGPQEVYLVDLQ